MPLNVYLRVLACSFGAGAVVGWRVAAVKSSAVILSGLGRLLNIVMFTVLFSGAGSRVVEVQA